MLTCLAAWIAGDQAGIGKVWLLPSFAIALLGYGLAGWALGNGRPLASSELALLLPLYPLHGVAQQFVFQGILNRRLTTLFGRPFPTACATAAAFALVHFGSPVLMALTFPAGLAWSLLYQRRPNLWALGLSHGILAALAYPLVLGENPLAGG
ncbi:MAG: type II CAAX prenyl endopeptidase Rce1 family protein [Planctomycetota bacterium]